MVQREYHSYEMIKLYEIFMRCSCRSLIQDPMAGFLLKKTFDLHRLMY